MNSIARNIKRFTIDQWSIIDNKYIRSETKSDLKCIIAIIFLTFILIIQRYYGQSRFFTNTFGNYVVNLPLSGIWSRLYSTFACLILYVLLPYLYIKLMLKENITDHGIAFRGISRYIPIYLAMILVMMPILIGVSFTDSFSNHYPLYSGAGESLIALLVWEANYGLYFIALEFFFRGFILFTLARYIGSYSIFVMVIPYVMIHFGKPVAETIGSIIAGIALGTLSLRSGSIFGGVFIHIIIAWSMDILALIQNGKIQNLLYHFNFISVHCSPSF